MPVFLIIAGLFVLLGALEIQRSVRNVWRDEAAMAAESAGSAALMFAIALMFFVMGH